MTSDQVDQPTAETEGQKMILRTGKVTRSSKLQRGVESVVRQISSGEANPFMARAVDGKPEIRPGRRGEPAVTDEERSAQAVRQWEEHEVPDRRYDAFCRLVRSRGERYAGCTLESFEANVPEKRKARNEMASFLDSMGGLLRSFQGGLVIVGPVGTGKDHLLFAAMREAVLVHGYSVRWMDGLQLFADIKKAVGENRTNEFLKTLIVAQILGISDPVPPRGELTDFELSVLRDVVERRYARGLPTWVTTNVLDKADGDRLFSSPVMDRLKDGATIIHCSWESHRKPVPNDRKESNQ